MTSEVVGAEVDSVCPHFEYKPLPDSSTYIRLLEILEGDFDQHVRCELTTWALSEAPPYAAISYTWGDPGDVAHVTVDGKSLEHQSGDVAEKSGQVAIFATLYSKADQLLVCVGPHDDGSNELFDVFRHKAELLDSILRHSTHTKIPTPQPSANRSQSRLMERFKDMKQVTSASRYISKKVIQLKGIPLGEVADRHKWSGALDVDGHLVWLRCAGSGQWNGKESFGNNLFAFMRDVTFPERSRIIESFLHFMKRAYFSRLWVLQELQLGQTKLLCCGKDVHKFDHLIAIHQLIRIWLQEVHFSGLFGALLDRKYRKLGFSLEQLRQATELERLKYQTGCIRLGVVKAQSVQLPHLLDALDHFQCADSRDRIFGTMSLIDWDQWTSREYFTVDYSMDAFLVAKKVMTILLCHHSSATYNNDGAGIELVRRAETLRRLLKYTLENSSLYHGLAYRSLPWPESEGTWEPYARMPDFDWWAYPLQDWDTSARDELLFYCRPSHHSSVAELVNSHGHVIAYLPQNTKGGDWLLLSTYWYLSRPELRGIIMQPCPDEKNRLLGLTVPIKYERSRWPNTYQYTPPRVGDYYLDSNTMRRFKIRWDSVDLLVLEWRYAHAEAMPATNMQPDVAAEFCAQRICTIEKSSYAVGPYQSHMEFYHDVEAFPGYRAFKYF
ncbi:hypothetical protein BKA63DRAFT_606253 [Paraphoma chrysanthemicola]|nr:hypothetical protein BKA63DRAFT_606253 [Paraphoma chrysanthemicola]